MMPETNNFTPDPLVAANIEKLSDITIDKIYLTVLDIEYKLETATSNIVLLSTTFDHVSQRVTETDTVRSNYRQEALDKLNQWGITSDPKPPSAFRTIEAWNLKSENQCFVVVNVKVLNGFRDFFESIRSERSLEKPEGPLFPKILAAISSEPIGSTPPAFAANNSQGRTKNEFVYEIHYTPAREIILNGFLLAKIDFNSENDNIFSFIIKNPNRTITIEELAKNLGGKVPKKNLHKFAENIGFRGELKKAFFNISKNGIMLTNPLNDDHLKALGLQRIKFGLK